jgi:hypothetical protein
VYWAFAFPTRNEFVIETGISSLQKPFSTTFQRESSPHSPEELLGDLIDQARKLYSDLCSFFGLTNLGEDLQASKEDSDHLPIRRLPKSGHMRKAFT